MDESGVLHDMKKITIEENIFNLRNLVIKKPSQEYPLKSEGHQNTTRPCSELTRMKLKERLEGKDADIVISEDDGNNSFLQKSGQDETTQNSRNIPETSPKDETTEDNTDMFDTFHTEGQETQDNTHLSETSEMRDEIKEDYTEGETTQDGTHISETSEMQDQTETQDQTEKQDQRETQDETSSPEESKKKKQKIKMDDFFQNASILPDGSDSEGIRSTKPAYQTFEETGNNDRKRKDQGNGKTAKRSGKNTTNSSSKKKAEEVRSLYNEGYYTDNINSDSLHQESEYQDITDDDINPKNKKKKPNKKDDWSDKALEDFLETLREQPVKEMNDRRNKWIMFSKRLQKKGTNKTNDDCRKKVFTINSLSHVKGSWGMYPSLGEMLNMTLLSYIIQV